MGSEIIEITELCGSVMVENEGKRREEKRREKNQTHGLRGGGLAAILSHRGSGKKKKILNSCVIFVSPKQGLQRKNNNNKTDTNQQ